MPSKVTFGSSNRSYNSVGPLGVRETGIPYVCGLSRSFCRSSISGVMRLPRAFSRACGAGMGRGLPCKEDQAADQGRGKLGNASVGVTLRSVLIVEHSRRTCSSQMNDDQDG